MSDGILYFRKPCKRWGKRWCGTNDRVRELYSDAELADQLFSERITFGSKECRDEGPQR